ncbi:MAG: hypothetical protein MI976_07605 [Pseudomonadales bacterium]|nr:hypothetical protein [Pseudomonadales bacterium]
MAYRIPKGYDTTAGARHSKYSGLAQYGRATEFQSVGRRFNSDIKYRQGKDTCNVATKVV